MCNFYVIDMVMVDKAQKKRQRGRPPLEAGDGRDDIKRAALAEFAKRGFTGTRIDHIADTAGVAKRLVHYYFGSKDELWQVAVSEAYNQFRDEAIAFAAQLGTNPSDDALDLFTQQMVRFAAQRVALIQISIDETRQGGARAEWLTSNYLVPLQQIMIGQITITFRDRDDAKGIASHMIPSIFGATVFPFVDADVTGKAHGVDVFADQYIAEHAAFIRGLLEACLHRYA